MLPLSTCGHADDDCGDDDDDDAGADGNGNVEMDPSLIRPC